MEKIEEIKQYLKSKGLKQKSIKTYSIIIEKVINRLGETFTEEQLEKLFTSLNLKPRSYNLHRTVMNFYTKKYLDYTIKFSKAKVDKSLPTYVSKNEFNQLIKVTPNIKHRVGLGLMYLCGLRIFEVVRLKRHDIYLDKKAMLIKGKGGKHRDVFISKYLFERLKQFYNTITNNDPYLFQTYNGHICERSFQEVLKRARKKARLTKHFSLHDLRHSFAVNMLNRGIDLKIIKDLLGHSSLRTTEIYLQCRTTDLTKLAAIC